MDPGEFIKTLDKADIARTIKTAEQGTTGELRIFITQHEPALIMKAAHQQFAKLGMSQTKDRNGVLIYVAPLARKFAIIGDEGVHKKCGDAFWKAVADEMSSRFKKGEFTTGIKHGILKAGELLAKHFPSTGGHFNQIADEVETD